MGITAEMVKRLRVKTGAGMMDCKKALAETSGDEEKAVEFLRQKGLANARKKETRQAKEGIIGSYVHAGGKIAVMVEVNCETDFVARTPEFQEFARNLAMQVAAASPLYLTRDEVSAEVVAQEKTIYAEEARQAGKPEKVIDKIAEGKIDKYYGDVCLMEQAYVKDQNMTVDDLLQEIRGKLGENVQIRRFIRFQLGG